METMPGSQTDFLPCQDEEGGAVSRSGRGSQFENGAMYWCRPLDWGGLGWRFSYKCRLLRSRTKATTVVTNKKTARKC